MKAEKTDLTYKTTKLNEQLSKTKDEEALKLREQAYKNNNDLKLNV